MAVDERWQSTSDGSRRAMAVDEPCARAIDVGEPKREQNQLHLTFLYPLQHDRTHSEGRGIGRGSVQELGQHQSA